MKEIQKNDSLLREKVKEEEQFGISARTRRDLPIEGMHFFCPLKGVISQGYNPVTHPYIDITAPEGSVVKATLDGTVIYAGWSDDTGYTIQIQHEGDIVSIYRHNEKLLKRSGDKVTAGSPIALIGNTGELTTGDHLHFELWHKGEAVDPTRYINF
jgi:murein DD-endopeptidase MepM/ murein hydrolase activator NlpD